MKDNLLIITRIKKTIIRLEKILENFNRNEIVLRDNIKSTMYKLLENAYAANISNDNSRIIYQKIMLVNIKMLDFYLNCAYTKKMISPKQYSSIGNHLIETLTMIQAWIKSEKSK